jgi:hypothetical protein
MLLLPSDRVCDEPVSGANAETPGPEIQGESVVAKFTA